jgi:hypothetical protein
MPIRLIAALVALALAAAPPARAAADAAAAAPAAGLTAAAAAESLRLDRELDGGAHAAAFLPACPALAAPSQAVLDAAAACWGVSSPDVLPECPPACAEHVDTLGRPCVAAYYGALGARYKAIAAEAAGGALAPGEAAYLQAQEGEFSCFLELPVEAENRTTNQ